MGQALGTSVTDPVKNLRYRDGSRLWRHPGRRVLPSIFESALASVRVGMILHLPVLLAFANSSGLQQYRPRPAFNRAVGRASFPEH